jgi:hypothetical protein
LNCPGVTVVAACAAVAALTDAPSTVQATTVRRTAMFEVLRIVGDSTSGKQVGGYRYLGWAR